MCITSETCRANSVIKTALNNLHQADPKKTPYMMMHGNTKINLQVTSLFHTEKFPIKYINTIHAAQCNTKTS